MPKKAHTEEQIGRQMQTSLWDGNADYTTSWGYNPIEAGDHMFHGSPLLVSTLMPDSIYTKTQPIQWAPENFGDGTDPLLGDAYIEKWISVVPGLQPSFQSPLQDHAFRNRLARPE